MSHLLLIAMVGAAVLVGWTAKGAWGALAQRARAPLFEAYDEDVAELEPDDEDATDPEMEWRKHYGLD